MLTTKNALFALMLTLSCLCSASASRADTSDDMGSLQDAKSHTREEFVHSMADTTLSVLQDPKKSFPDRKVLLRQCFMTVVDIDWIAKFTLGRMWNNASDDQKKRYTELYRTFLTESYVSNFAENPDKRIKDIKILGIQDAEDNSFVVNTNVQLADREEVRVDYRVSDRDGKYKVIDIIIENVSLLVTHRNQFGEIAATQGVESVIAKLQALNEGRGQISISMR